MFIEMHLVLVRKTSKTGIHSDDLSMLNSRLKKIKFKSKFENFVAGRKQ